MWYRLCIAIFFSVGASASGIAKTQIVTAMNQQSSATSERDQAQGNGVRKESESLSTSDDVNSGDALA